MSGDNGVSELQEFIRQACSDRGMSLYELAALCGDHDRKYVYRWLSRPIRIDTLERMLRALGCTITCGVTTLTLQNGESDGNHS